MINSILYFTTVVVCILSGVSIGIAVCQIADAVEAKRREKELEKSANIARLNEAVKLVENYKTVNAEQAERIVELLDEISRLHDDVNYWSRKYNDLVER